MSKEKSCGAVIFTRDNGVLKFVLIEDLEGNYGFPKGHMEENETEQQTALREVKEETGLSVEIIDGFKTFDVYLAYRNKVVKTVIYFLATYSDQPLVAQKEEVKSAILLPFKQCLKALRFKGAKRVLSEAYDFILENKL
ncbi:MAG TPA: NUDIX domain-containing protein [Erysipelotrichaceae bacterium]|nr:NUDIX domain-containing protein [Erysipelotrichaceae bacterium]